MRSAAVQMGRPSALRLPALLLALCLLALVPSPTLARSLSAQQTELRPDLQSFFDNNNYDWLAIALKRLGFSSLGQVGEGPNTYLLPSPPSNASAVSALAANAKKRRLRSKLYSHFLVGAYISAAELLEAGEVPALAGPAVNFTQAPNGAVLATIKGISYVVNPVAIPLGNEDVVYLLEGEAPAMFPRTAVGVGVAAAEGLVLSESGDADTQWCIKVRFGLPDGVRVIVSGVDNYDWADTRRPDATIGDRVFLPGAQWCTALNTNMNSNPRITVSVGKMPLAQSDPANAEWQSFRMEMDTWWLRTFAVSVWQGATAWVGSRIDVGFPSLPVPWPMVDSNSFEAFPPHVSITWESGYF